MRRSAATSRSRAVASRRKIAGRPRPRATRTTRALNASSSAGVSYQTMRSPRPRAISARRRAPSASQAAMWTRTSRIDQAPCVRGCRSAAAGIRRTRVRVAARERVIWRIARRRQAARTAWLRRGMRREVIPVRSYAPPGPRGNRPAGDTLGRARARRNGTRCRRRWTAPAIRSQAGSSSWPRDASTTSTSTRARASRFSSSTERRRGRTSGAPDPRRGPPLALRRAGPARLRPLGPADWIRLHARGARGGARRVGRAPRARPLHAGRPRLRRADRPTLALERPEQVRRLILLNTWMWPLDDDPEVGGRRGWRRARWPLLYRRGNASLRLIMPGAYSDRR